MVIFHSFVSLPEGNLPIWFVFFLGIFWFMGAVVHLVSGIYVSWESSHVDSCEILHQGNYWSLRNTLKHCK